jgi:hypothetical protein
MGGPRGYSVQVLQLVYHSKDYHICEIAIYPAGATRGPFERSSAPSGGGRWRRALCRTRHLLMGDLWQKPPALAPPLPDGLGGATNRLPQQSGWWINTNN